MTHIAEPTKDEIKDRRGHLRDGVFVKLEEKRDEQGLPLGVAA